MNDFEYRESEIVMKKTHLIVLAFIGLSVSLAFLISWSNIHTRVNLRMIAMFKFGLTNLS